MQLKETDTTHANQHNTQLMHIMQLGASKMQVNQLVGAYPRP